ncbi:C4-dicarboxylate ABC transporter permease [Sporosarcina sp. P13]|uniref:TRAP transporter small permease n=1 Tax=Sporosarcina sp. P13 TaxID=2048263 RepID=UPI000C169C63|nr:TRAP transporter small permease [Sporosarcina sp. P13]PIC64934.1 C4-dicarboxylate ABC transporter permease [Sporosarcina sp. P13]
MRNDQLVEFDIESASPDERIYKEKVTSSSNLFFKATDYLNQFLAVIAGVALLSMMLLIVFNSIKRIYSDPIAGTVEIVSWLGAITGIFALGYTQLNKGHVYIDMLLDKFPAMLQRVIHTIVNVLSAIFFLVAAWQLLLYGLKLQSDGIVSQTIQFSFYPLVILSSIGFIGLVLAITKETVLIWKEAS